MAQEHVYPNLSRHQKAKEIIFNIKERIYLQRIKTWILGLDQITGGFPVGRTIIIGDVGTGKTIFGPQFAKSCSTQNLKTVYTTTEEDANDLQIQSASFGWNMKYFKERGILKFIELAGVRARVTEAEMSIEFEAMKGNLKKLLQDLPEDTKVVIIDGVGSHTAITPYRV